MESQKPLKVVVQAKGVLPHKLALDAAAALIENGRVEVVSSPNGFELYAAWERDAELALERLREALGLTLQVSNPQVIYQKKAQWLEPRMHVVAATPEDFLGDVIGDFNQRRGVIQGIADGEGGKQISAIVPLIELIGYSKDLEILTHGRGRASVRLFDYHPVPPGHGPDPDEPSSAALRA